MKPADALLLGIVAEPRARRTVSREFGLPSGAVPVLAAIAFLENQGESPRPRDVYAAELASPTLIRSYLRTLRKLELVAVRYVFKKKYLRLTGKGYQAIGQYERGLREGCTAFGQVKLVRVLANPVL